VVTRVASKPYPTGDIAFCHAYWFSESVTLLVDVASFLYNHRTHGALTADATEPAWNGYLLTVVCPCGVVFERWVTPEDADADLAGNARLT
jgi:hypothetical protein